MKGFWWGLVFFILLMCSCRTSRTSGRTQRAFSSDVSVLNEVTEADTTKRTKIAETENLTLIRETSTKVEFEGSSIKTITTETRDYMNVNNEVMKESEEKGVAVSKMENVTASENEDESTEVKEETEAVSDTFFKSMGKWTGIGMVIAVALVLVWNKIKSWLG